MGWPQCNSTLEDMAIEEKSLFDSHDVTFHRLALGLSAVFGLIAIVVSLLLMFMHTIRYSRPTEQRHIIRILFMVPVYAMVSFLSIVFYQHSVYYEVLRDCYEAFAIASFFSLMCAYIADDLHGQKEYFRKIRPRPWIWPMTWFKKCAGGDNGWLRTPRSGLTWFNVIWVAVFQYCFIRVSMTITAVITQYFDRYCLESLNPAFAHIWVMVIEGIAVTITMYCIIQFYVQLRQDIAQHKPVLKVLAIKLVIFLSFWQTILISFLTSAGVINASAQIAAPDIKVGMPSTLLCIEMAFFAIFHLWSFSYKPYVIGSKQYQAAYGHLNEAQPRYQGGPLGLKAMVDCFNPWDLIKATGRAAKWLFRDRKHRTKDSSYATVDDAQKMNDLNAPTRYGGAGSSQPKTSTGDEAGSGLLASAQFPAQQQVNRHEMGESDSSGASPWTEVEAKEYFQDQRMRNQDPRRDQFDFGFARTHQNNPYDSVYKETQYYPPRQDTGITGSAGTTTMPQGPYGRSNELPTVSREDIENMQQSQGAPPYPRTLTSVSTRANAPQTHMPPLPPGQRPRTDGFI